jgi:hypothetical protein
MTPAIIHSSILRVAVLVCIALAIGSFAPCRAGEPAPISATELWKAYKDDPAAGDKLYKGKTIVVTGPVYWAGVNPISQGINVTLKDDDGNDRVSCTFPASAKAAVTALKEDQKVKIKGTVDGPLFKMGVTIKDCELVSK